MYKRISTLFLVLVLLPVLLFSQEKSIKQKAPLIFDAPTHGVFQTTPLGTDVPVTAANYVAVDTMSNTFGPASPTLNPVVYDPSSGYVAVVHRGNANTYAAGSGELWWNYSTDYGTTWPRSTTSVQNGLTSQILARYPSMTIFNPTGSSTVGEFWGAFSWPELLSSFAFLGYGVTLDMMESAFAEINFDPPTYSSNIPTFSDDAYIYWATDNQDDASIRLFRTADYGTIDIIDPPNWSDATFGGTGNITMGGVYHNGVLYYGVQGSFLDEIGLGGWEPGYCKSIDHGSTWSDWFVVDWHTIGFPEYEELWDWKKGDTYVSYAGDIQVDKDGFVHMLVGLTDLADSNDDAGYNAIVEFYEDGAEGVWAAKVLAEGDDVVHDRSFYETPDDPAGNAQDPAVGQCGPSFMISTNEARDFFTAQWVMGSPEAGDSLCDIYYQTRSLDAGRDEWSYPPINLTDTDAMNEDGAHAAPYLATTVEFTATEMITTDWLFSMYWYEAGNTHYLVNSLNPTVVYIAPVPVREEIVMVNVENDINNFSYELQQNYPNPFNPATSIKFTLPAKQFVTLKVYDVVGREVATLVNEERNAGPNEVTFDATNLASGMYLYTINSGSFTSTKKMLLLK